MTNIETDVLVVGGGSAACRAALEAARAGARVLMLDKGRVARSGSSPVALVGYSAFLGDEGDSADLFLKDWIKAAGGICDQNLVMQVIDHGAAVAQDLTDLGVKFIRNDDGSWFLSRRAGHSAKRTLMVQDHANAILPIKRAAVSLGVQTLEKVLTTRLLRRDGRVIGAMAVDADGHWHVISARATVLAAGGANRIYPNAAEEIEAEVFRTTGDAFALAYEAGTSFVDMEFGQFRDSPPAGPLYGAQYINALGERVMLKYDPVALENAPRHMMARAVYTENIEGRGPVVWHVEENQVARSRAPVGLQYKAGQIVPIVLMFQRLMGGARIDAQAATGVPGLFAAGESSGGVQGGDRMQGCGFPETQVFGLIAGRNAAAYAAGADAAAPDAAQVDAERTRLSRNGGTLQPAEFMKQVQAIMWAKVGVSADRKRLQEAIGELQTLRHEVAPTMIGHLPAAIEAANLVLTAELVAHAKLAREESRSAHNRSDHPTADDTHWIRHVRLSRDAAGEIRVDTVPVVTRTAA